MVPINMLKSIIINVFSTSSKEKSYKSLFHHDFVSYSSELNSTKLCIFDINSDGYNITFIFTVKLALGTKLELDRF